MIKKRRCPVFVEKHRTQIRIQTKLKAAEYAQPWEVTLALRNIGWAPYRVWFDSETTAWIARVIDWGAAA
jgi:hypothetical protein